VIIPIEKKCGARDYVDFRTISLVLHVSKIVLKILTCRLECTAESYFWKDQFRFRNASPVPWHRRCSCSTTASLVPRCNCGTAHIVGKEPGI